MSQYEFSNGTGFIAVALKDVLINHSDFKIYASNDTGCEEKLFCVFNERYLKKNGMMDMMCTLSIAKDLILSGYDDAVLPMPEGLIRVDGRIIGFTLPKPEILDLSECISLEDYLVQIRKRSGKFRQEQIERATNLLTVLGNAFSSLHSVSGGKVFFSHIDPSLVFMSGEKVCYLGFMFLCFVDVEPLGLYSVVSVSRRSVYYDDSKHDCEIYGDLLVYCMNIVMSGADWRDKNGQLGLGRTDVRRLKGSEGAFIWTYFPSELREAIKTCFGGNSRLNWEKAQLFLDGLKIYSSILSGQESIDPEALEAHPSRPMQAGKRNLREQQSVVLSVLWWTFSASITGCILAVLIDSLSIAEERTWLLTACIILVLLYWLSAFFSSHVWKVVQMVGLCLLVLIVTKYDSGVLCPVLEYSLLSLKRSWVISILGVSFVVAVFMVFLRRRYINLRNDHMARSTV